MPSILTSLTKSQFLPSLDDVKNDNLKKLANRLTGGSDRETLTNVLDWQVRNIQYWWERFPFDLSLKFLIPISSFLIVTIFSPFLLLLYSSKLSGFFYLFLVLAVIIFFVLVFHNIILKIFYLFLSLPIIYFFTVFSLRIPILAQYILPYTLIYVGCLGAITLMVVYFFIRYGMLLGEKPLKEKIAKFVEVVNDTFRSNLAVDKILEYKLAVCRDYAKLTASLLFNAYPNSELYFITIRMHVAVGITIENKCYVLDQLLPILSKDTWLRIWGKKATIYSSKLIKDSEGKPKVTFDFYRHEKKREKSKADIPKINTDKLTEEIAKVFGIKQSLHVDNTNLEIPLYNYANYYDDDEIIKYSLIRAIKNRLESEFCGNMDKISKVAITQNEKDLTVTVSI